MSVKQKGYRVVIYRVVGLIVIFYFLLAILWNSAYLVSFIRSDPAQQLNWIKIIALYIGFLIIVFFGFSIYSVFPEMVVTQLGIRVTYFGYFEKFYFWKDIDYFERSRRLRGVWVIRTNLPIFRVFTHGLLFPLIHGVHAGVFAHAILLSESCSNFAEVSREIIGRINQNEINVRVK
jgi:hypothetical protein